MAAKEAETGFPTWWQSITAIRRVNITGANLLKKVLTPTFTIYAVVFGTILVGEAVFAAPLLFNANTPWEDLSPEKLSGYRRFPMNFRLALGWGFLSLLALIVAIIIHFSSKVLGEIFERLGANVLIHLTVNGLLIHGFFRIQRWHLDHQSNKTAIAFAVSAFTLGATQLLIYLARSARK